MPTSYTSLIGLALPQTGELSGTWGDTVNDYITRYLDAAIAGAQTISGNQTAVTLSTTNGSTLVSAGAGATGSAQYSIINCTGNPAATLVVTVPTASKVYLVLNATSTSQSVTVKPSAAAGITVAAGRAALIAWNGSDFVRVATNDLGTLTGTISLTTQVTGTLPVANGGTGVTTSTGTGSTVLSTSPTLVTPLLGTPTSGNLSNCTNIPVGSASGTLPVANGGTGDTTYTNGQLLIGNTTGNTLTKATLTAGTGISITNGTGSITVTSTIAPTGSQVFNSTGTFTVPANVTSVKVTVIGGGGGGGAAFYSGCTGYAYGGGGGGGGVSIRQVTGLTPGGTVAVTVGNGGTGGTTGNGGSGSTSSFGASASATGGGGGVAVSVSPWGYGALGTNGTGSSGDVNLSGYRVGINTNVPNIAPVFGGAAVPPTTHAVGVAGINLGSGGTGGTADTTVWRAGGAGSNGIVIVEW